MFEPAKAPNLVSTGARSRLVLVPFSEIKPVAIPWIWPGYFARGYMTPLVGDGGVGKGTIFADIAARLSRGDVMPDGAPNPFGGVPKASIILESEDSPENVLSPRLAQQNADMSRVYFLTVKDHGSFNLGTHLAELEEQITANPDIVFLAISAVNDFLPAGMKTGMDSEVRAKVLNPLTAMVTRTHIAACAIHHIGKQGERAAHHRTLDSVAYYNKPRLMLGAVAGRESDGAPTFGELGGLKNNLGPIAPCVGYRIDAMGLTWTGVTGNMMKDLFDQGTAPTTVMPVDQALSALPAGAPGMAARRAQALGLKGKFQSRYMDGEALIYSMLSTGPEDKTKVVQALHGIGIGDRLIKTLQTDIDIKTIVTNGKASWSLPKILTDIGGSLTP